MVIYRFGIIEKMKSVDFVEKQEKFYQFYPQYTPISVPGEFIYFFLFDCFSHQEWEIREIVRPYRET